MRRMVLPDSSALAGFRQAVETKEARLIAGLPD